MFHWYSNTNSFVDKTGWQGDQPVSAFITVAGRQACDDEAALGDFKIKSDLVLTPNSGLRPNLRKFFK